MAYYAEEDKRKMYFYINNSLIRYYNTINIPILTMDIVGEGHKILDLANTKYVNNDPSSIVIVTEQGNQYLVSNDVEYIDSFIRNEKRNITVWFSCPELNIRFEVQNKTLLYCTACFYYLSGLAEFDEIKENNTLTQSGIMLIKSTRIGVIGVKKRYYEARYNRLSSPLDPNYTDFTPIVFELKVNKKTIPITK